MRTQLSAGFLLLACSTGCSVADRSASEHPVRDSAGIEIVLNRISSPQFQAWSLSAAPELRIGAIEGDSVYQFYRGTAVRSLSGGRIVVANGGTRELRFYDAAGTFISRVGRDGAGPGEFKAIDNIAVVQDSIWVSDPRLTRLSLFTSEGRFVRSVMLSASQNLVLPRLLGVFDDGTLLVEDPVEAAHEATGLQPIHSNYYHLDRDGAILDTLGQFETGQHLMKIGERGASSVRLPFARVSTVATAGSHFYFGSAERYEARRFTREGRLDRIIRRDEPPTAITPQDLDRYIEAVARVNLDPNARQRLEAMYRGVPLPPATPAYLSFRVDTEDHLWVEEYRLFGDALSRWTVFDQEGIYLGTLDLPPGFTLHEIGPDFLLGVRVDDSDVEYVERYTLQRLDPRED